MSVKKLRRAEKVPTKFTAGVHSKASHDLRRLQSLLARSRQEGAALSQSKACSGGGGGGGRAVHPAKDSSSSSSRRRSDEASEASEMEKFSITYKDQRCFSSHPQNKLFLDILTSLVKTRLCSEWIDQAPSESVLRVLICLRLLIRDPQYQKVFHQLQGVTLLAQYTECVTASYMSCGEDAFAIQKLVTMTYMFQKLSAAQSQKVWVIESGAHRTLAKLLSTTDSSVLLGALLALTTLAESSECKGEIGELPIVESLLVILQEYDILAKRMSAELLRLLSPVQGVRDQLRELEGVPVLLSLLHGRHLKLLWSVAWVLVQLCQDPDTRAEIRSWGGLQQLLRLLSSDRHYVSDRSSIGTLSSANAAGRIQKEHAREELSPEEEVDNTLALQSACCTALTEMSLDDTSAHHIVQENGVFIIAKLILPPSSGPKAASLQCYALRTLRFLFSVERNRHLFKRLFPTDLFELFIDVGHYVRDLSAYQALQSKISLYTEEDLDSLRESIKAVDQNRPPLRVISGYAVLDHLGTGAFGSVFKVQRQSGQNLLALKEVNLHNPAFGKDKRSRDSNVEKIISELTIIKEQMMHPNIVKYYKTFVEGDKLYVVMELIEGVPLADHFSSLKEKQQRFTEDRIWNIFMQMCLALRYLHKEKRIVHRDLTPNNIMLGEKDKVTITDFGLAKQKEENSKLTSVVGTILYCCPEVVKNEPYGEKADIWALGCVLYQMAALRPPFYSANMLSLASKIVEGVYEPVGGEAFSERVTDMIGWCLSPDVERRPDIVAVTSRISDLMMRLMDGLYASHNALEKRAARDRKRAQKYFLERHRNKTDDFHAGGVTQDRPVTAAAADSVDLRFSPACCSNDGEQRSSRDGLLDEEVETCDPSKNTSACDGRNSDFSSSACATPDHTSTSGDLPSVKIKSRPVSAGICVSQKKLRQIDDPIQRLLVLLHKIIFITQLPPDPHRNVKRRLVEKFKKSLFHAGSDPCDLKVELSKLLQASPELMELSSTGWLVQHFTEEPGAAGGTLTVEENLKDGVTYQQMQAMVEELLQDNDYYYGGGAHSRFPENRNDQKKEEE
ncbi:unnamed protein product [Ophioblennius macclurei]